MAISTVNVDFSAILQNAAQATGLLRVRLSQVGTVEDSETGNEVILPITWQETTLTDGAATLALVPNKLIEPSCTYYEIQLKSVPDCPKACAKLLLSGIMYVPDEDCNVLDLLISPPSPETANTASGYASQAKQAAQVAEYFAVQAGDRYDDVAEAAATALTDIGTAKQDALDAIGTAQSGATEAISTAEEAALQAIGQARGTALDDIGTAQGTAIGAVQAEGNTQVGRVEDAGEDAVADVTAAQATAVSAVQAQQSTSVAAVTAEGTRQTGLVTAEGTAQVNAVTQAGNGYVSTMQGLVSDAQAARDAAQTAQGLAEDAQAAAESASTDAQGYAGDASTSAGQAAQSASDAADSATAAQASADSIAASAEQIQTNADNITALETKTDITNKNVANIQALLNGTLYREETDSVAAYSKSVPTGAMPYASVDMIGGKTVVWNQRLNLTSVNSSRGITSTINLDTKIITFTGTATSSGYIDVVPYYYNSVPIVPAGHKYLCVQTTTGLAAEEAAHTAGFYTVQSGNEYLEVFGTASYIYQSAGRYFLLRFKVVEGVTYNATARVMVFDLTLMFGAGNEPTTVEQFRAMFPAAYYPYNTGELRSAGVTEVESEGVNKIPPIAAVTKTSNSITAVSDGIGTVTFTGTASAFSVFTFDLPKTVDIPVSTSAGGTYALYINNSFTAHSFSFLLDGAEIATWNLGTANRVITTWSSVEGKSFDQIAIKISSGAATNGTVALAFLPYDGNSEAHAHFIPYMTATLPIPSAVQSLPGYGWSAGTAYNYIDFDRKVYVQNVGSVDLGTLAYTKSSMGVGDVFLSTLSDAKPVSVNTDIFNGISSAFKTVSRATFNSTSSESLVALNTLAQLILYTTVSYTDAASFKAAMQGVMLQYELATPVETDISSLLSDSTIEVEPGGTLTFKNQHGDDWRVPVPNEETFLVQAAPELPSADGTYTLQCTVTDGTPSVTWVTA